MSLLVFQQHAMREAGQQHNSTIKRIKDIKNEQGYFLAIQKTETDFIKKISKDL